MDGDFVARVRGHRGNFRQCHNHVSALRYRGGSNDCELAGIASCLGARVRKEVRLLGLSGLSDSIVERACVAAQADRLLAITGMESSFACSWFAACLGDSRCGCIYL